MTTTNMQTSAAAITDPIITPFVKAKVAAGYQIKKRNAAGNCDHLEECPSCRNRYRYTFIKDGVETKCCPHCGN